MAQRRSPGKYLVYSVSSQVGLSAGAEGNPEILGPSRTPNATVVHAPAVLVGERRRWALTLGRAVWGGKCCMPSALHPWSQRWPSEERWCLEEEAVRLGGEPGEFSASWP